MPPPVEERSALAEARTVPHLRSVSAPYPFAGGPVLAIAAVVAVLLLVLSERYGYLSDELYFLSAGKYHLDWGYMDQQPLVPLLAAGLDALAPGSLLVLRLPALVVTVAGVVVTALTARELGADRRAQTLAASAFAVSPWLLLSGHWLTAATMEPIQWAVVLWLVTRWTRLRHMGVRRDRLLLVASLVVAVALQTKFQVVILCAALLISAAIAGPRALPRRPVVWAGGAIAAATSLPTLLWQAEHHWPARDMGAVVSDESDRLLLLPTGLVYSGLVVGAVLCCYGLWQLLRAPLLRHVRFLGWAVAGVVVLYLVVGGRANYLASLYVPLFAAAVFGLQQRRIRNPRAAWVAWPAYTLSALLAIGFLPVYPLPLLASRPGLPSASRLYETGWPELARTVARTYHSLPPETQHRTAIVGSSYHIASAVDVLGRDLRLPRAYGPDRGYWFFGQPPESAEVVLAVGSAPGLDRYFETEQQLATVESDLANVTQGVPIVRYDHPTQPWSVIWPAIRQ